MKKVSVTMFVFVLLMSLCAASFAGNEVTPGNKTGEITATAATTVEQKSTQGRSELLAGPNEKMSRGVKNALFGWTEIPKTIISTTKESNPIIGITIGTLKGIAKAFPRTVSGIADVVTFPVGDYKKPLINPDPLVEGQQTAVQTTKTIK